MVSVSPSEITGLRPKINTPARCSLRRPGGSEVAWWFALEQFAPARPFQGFLSNLTIHVDSGLFHRID